MTAMMSAIVDALESLVSTLRASYAAIEMTRVVLVGLPTRYADGNTENASTKVRQKVMARPGASSGKVICQNRRRGLAPRVDAAASRLGSIPDRYDRISRNANGNPLITSGMTTPQQLPVSATPSSPTRRSARSDALHQPAEALKYRIIPPAQSTVPSLIGMT